MKRGVHGRAEENYKGAPKRAHHVKIGKKIRRVYPEAGEQEKGKPREDRR